MMVSLKYFIIVCPLVFLAGIVDAIAGGGGLITLPAYLIAGLPAHSAIATNKLSSTMGTAMATYQYSERGYIRWKLAVFCACFSLLGSNLGARLSLLISESYLGYIMLVLLPLTAVLVLKNRVLEKERQGLSGKATFILGAVISFFLGMYDGFYGPGTGTFLLILLTSVVRLKLSDANGITKVINLASNVSAMIVYIINGKTVVVLGLVAGLFSIAGNYIGTRLFSEKGAKIAKPVMIAVLAVFLIRELTEILA